MKILIVEDEQAIAVGLKFNFEQEGYEVVHVVDGPSAIALFEQAEADDPQSGDAFDVIILDLMLPGMSGYETCRRIRALSSSVAILVLSARSLSEDRTLAFDAGTDQYMTKPFDLRELLSRVRNLIDRKRSAQTSEAAVVSKPEVYRFGRAVLDPRTFLLTVGEQQHELTSREFELLRYFLRHEGEVLPRAQILRDVWGEIADSSTRTIDNFVLRLRKLIEDDPADPQIIRSVRGTGYRFISQAETPTAAESQPAE